MTVESYIIILVTLLQGFVALLVGFMTLHAAPRRFLALHNVPFRFNRAACDSIVL